MISCKAPGCSTDGQAQAVHAGAAQTSQNARLTLSQAHWLAGTTILIDFAFPAYPDNMGHWAELIAPLFCTLAASNWRQAAGGKPVGTVIFTNLGGNSLEASSCSHLQQPR